jgi:hypothetical protein
LKIVRSIIYYGVCGLEIVRALDSTTGGGGSFLAKLGFRNRWGWCELERERWNSSGMEEKLRRL